MRFKVTLDKKPKHNDIVSCVGWTIGDDLFSCRYLLFIFILFHP